MGFRILKIQLSAFEEVFMNACGSGFRLFQAVPGPSSCLTQMCVKCYAISIQRLLLTHLGLFFSLSAAEHSTVNEGGTGHSDRNR